MFLLQFAILLQQSFPPQTFTTERKKHIYTPMAMSQNRKKNTPSIDKWSCLEIAKCQIRQLVTSKPVKLLAGIYFLFFQFVHHPTFILFSWYHKPFLFLRQIIVCLYLLPLLLYVFEQFNRGHLYGFSVVCITSCSRTSHCDMNFFLHTAH